MAPPTYLSILLLSLAAISTTTNAQPLLMAEEPSTVPTTPNVTTSNVNSAVEAAPLLNSVVPVAASYPGIVAASDNTDTELPEVQPAAALLASDSLSSSYSPPTVSNLRVSAGITGGAIDPSIIPRGNIFTTFDVRPNGAGSVNGFQARMPWTQASVNAALGTASTSASPSIKTGTVSSDQELTKALSVSVSANGAFLGGAAKVESTFGYSSESSKSSKVVSGYTYGTMSLPGSMLANVNLLEFEPDVVATLSTDVNKFLDTYGTHYIKTRVYGCEASATYTFSCTTESAKQDIKASLSASYSGGAWSGSGTVSTTYATYSKANMCSFSGNMYSSGLDITNPSQSQLLDEKFMNTYWNGFSQACRNAAQNEGKLLYVELGNWMEVPAVTRALAGNTTATNILSFYGGMQPADLNAIAVAGMYSYKIDQAVQNLLPQYLTPWATTGFFDRTTRQAMPPTPQSYWTSLPTAHADIQQRLAKSDYTNFLNAQTIQNAIQNNIRISALVKQFYTAARQLYTDATIVYKYTYSGVSTVVLSFETDNKTPKSSQLFVDAATQSCHAFSQFGMQWCAMQYTNGGTAGLQHGINLGPSKSVPGAVRLYSHFAMPNVIGYDLDAENTSRGTAVDYLDFSSEFRSRTGCYSCPNVRFDMSIVYTMPDISFNASPY